MKTYSLYFNPNKKNNISFKSFYFTPSSGKEEDFGNLYIFQQLKDSKKNEDFLKELAEAIKEEYYEDSHLSVEDSLNKALSRGNDILEKKNIRGVNIAVFVITQNLSFFFSLCGDVEVFLGRGDEFFDFDESVGEDFSSQRSFSRILRGELQEGDRLILFNEELLEQLSEKELIQKLPYLRKEKQMKVFLKNKKTLKSLFGSMLFVFVKKPKKHFFFVPSFLRRNNNFSSRTFSSFWSSSSADLKRKIKKGIFFIFIFLILLSVAYFGF